MGIGEATNVTTGKARLSYVHLFKPYAAMQGQEEKFSVTVLIPKTDVETMARINAAIEAAKQKGMGCALRSYRLRFTVEMEFGQVTACRSEMNVKVIGCLPQVRR
mgnify:CR=1 FL=1